MYTVTVIVWILSVLIISIQYNRWQDRYNQYVATTQLGKVTKFLLVPFICILPVFFYIGIAAIVSLAIMTDVRGLEWKNVLEQMPVSWVLLTGTITLLISGLYNVLYYYVIFRPFLNDSIHLGTYVGRIGSALGVISSVVTLVAFWLDYL